MSINELYRWEVGAMISITPSVLSDPVIFIPKHSPTKTADKSTIKLAFLSHNFFMDPG